MASSAHKTEEEKKEIFDSELELESKCKKLGDLIKGSKHLVCFTGAGISTGAGIPDFRSGTETVLKTGPGAWEKGAVGEKAIMKGGITVSTCQAIPTRAHMSLIELERAGILKFVISQNTDGLHKRCGQKNLAELHGNSNLERCEACGRGYMRDFRACSSIAIPGHATGRRCEDPKCGGVLNDTIINFGENLPEWELKEGFRQAKLADLHLCLGSSLRVTPAADMPYISSKKGKLVIVNLQSTPLDHVAALRIGGMCDDVMQRVMNHLAIPIPNFILTRRLRLSLLPHSKLLTMFGESKLQGVGEYLFVEGIERDGLPFTLFTKVAIKSGGDPDALMLKREPFLYKVDRDNLQSTVITIILYFQCHYQEPPLEFDIDLKDLFHAHHKYIMEYDPQIAQWINIQVIE